ncbi:NAD(P)-binding domain-containing protein [Fodinicurvata sp. EGI_FJ10296]|uniref:flavin-containing monooxygenase n=1 Tax=Fodinicurvata sp. EGI_FJ10296 TaxID=3231908 RepID=UPI00345282F3
MARLTDLVVIGAGWAGLYAAKYARAAGLSVQILEKREAPGGVWNYSDDPRTITVMRNTVSSSSRHVTEASDFAMSPEAGNLFRHDDALAYLHSYADAFGLTPFIETGVHVARAHKTNGEWRVEAADGRVFRAHRIAVCTGVHQRKRPITGPAADFTGQIIHAGDIKHPADLQIGQDDHVIVYGGGETASDIVNDLANQTGARVTWAIRGGQHFFRKVPLRHGQKAGEYDRHDIALDEYSSAVVGIFSPPERGKPGMRYRCNLASSGSVLSYQGHGVAEWCNDIPWFKQFFNKNAHALDHVWNGRVTPARAITACEGDIVAFEDGRTARATHVICCFGYMSDVSFLPENIREVPSNKLFKLVFHPDDPSVSFFGLARPTILSLPYMIELQCMYAQKVWSGDLPLPDREARWSEAEAEAAEMDATFGHARSNRNVTCPFLYTRNMLRLLGGARHEAHLLFRHFPPLRDWRGFSRVIRLPLTPLLLRSLLGGAGAAERERMDRIVSLMPFGYKRRANTSLPRYVLTYAVVLGIPRLLALDRLFDWFARRRIARDGRAIGLRDTVAVACRADQPAGEDGAAPTRPRKAA